MVKEARAPLYMFEKRWEIFNLLWPLVPIGFFAAFFWCYGAPSNNSATFFQFISGLLFLNVVHNVWTVFIILYFPEGRAWLNSYTPAQRWQMLIRWGLIFAGLIYLFASIVPRLGPSAIPLTFILIFIGHYHHVIMQIRGISSAYNKIVQRSGGAVIVDEQRVRRAETLEGKLFSALLIVSAVSLWLNLNQVYRFRVVLFAISLLVIGAILLNSIRELRALESTKVLYQGRLIVFPLAILYPAAMLTMPFIHGVEYLAIFQKMWSKSEVREIKSTGFIWLVLIPVSLFVGVISVARMDRGYGRLLIDFFPNYSLIIFYLGVISIAFNNLHFYLDREIFRMRDPLVRKHFGPLIV